MPVRPPGSDWDVNGCIASAGYNWCALLGRCIRAWEESCDYPKNCLTWFDGCNSCQLVDGEIGLCTEMYCFAPETPYCSVPQPEVSIEPWLMNPPKPVIDPMPVPINPFTGAFHR